MSEKGKVKWFNKDKAFGRVSRADGSEAFLPPRTFRRGEDITEGDELEFDAEPDPDPARAGKFIAKNVTIITKVPRPLSPSAPMVPTPTPAPAASPPDARERVIDTSWLFGEIETFGDKILVPTWIELKADGSPIRDVEVSLSIMDNDGGRNPVLPRKLTPNSEGKVYFAPFLPAGTGTANLVAKVGEKQYFQQWPKRLPAPDPQPKAIVTIEPDTLPATAVVSTPIVTEPVKPSKPCKFIEVTAHGVEDGFSLFRVLALDEDHRPINTDIEIESGEKMLLKFKNGGDETIVEGVIVPIRTGRNNRLVRVRPLDPTAMGKTAVFRSVDDPTLATSPFPIGEQEACEPPVTPPKPCQTILVAPRGTEDGFSIFRIMTLDEDNQAVVAPLELESGTRMMVKFNGSEVDGFIVPITTSHGHKIVRVKPFDQGQVAEVTLRSVLNPTLESGPYAIGTPKPAALALRPCAFIEAKRLGQNGNGYTVWIIITLDKDRVPTDDDVQIESTTPLEGLDNVTLDRDTSSVLVTRTLEGQVLVKLKPTDPSTQPNVTFRSRHNPTVETLPTPLVEPKPVQYGPAKPPTISREYLKPDGTYLFRITDAPNCELQVCEATVETKLREVTCDDEGGWTRGKIHIGDTGTLLFQLRVTKVGGRGDVRFYIGDHRTGKYYVKHRNRPQPAMAAAGG